MILAKVVDNVVVNIIDTDKPENFDSYIPVPQHIPVGADLRFYHEDYTSKTEEELLSEGLIEVKDLEESSGYAELDPAQEIRDERNFKLAVLDSVVSNPLRWGSMTAEQQRAWADYRQALLDVPQQTKFPEYVEWPEVPT